MPSIPVDAGDVIEFAGLLGFLSDRLESDRDGLTASLAWFVGSPAYGPDSLRSDCTRTSLNRQPQPLVHSVSGVMTIVIDGDNVAACCGPWGLTTEGADTHGGTHIILM